MGQKRKKFMEYLDLSRNILINNTYLQEGHHGHHDRQDWEDCGGDLGGPGVQGEMGITQLPKTMKEKQDIVYQALGWLAREGKIIFVQKKTGTNVALSDQERDIYNSNRAA